MCTFLDGEIKALQSGENHDVDKNKLKEQLLRMADMVNNKMYILQSNKCISQEQKDAFIGRFNLVFNQALLEYDIGALTPEDIKKTMQSMNQSKSKASKKIQIENTIKENSKEEVQEQKQEKGYKTTKFGAVIDPNSYAEHLQPISQQNENKLTLKQRVAQFLQKNNIFMNLSFVEKFIHRQLDVLPSATQETRDTSRATVNRTGENFINEITNFGRYRNLPPIQRMSDPEKIARMQRKIEENQQANDDNERG